MPNWNINEIFCAVCDVGTILKKKILFDVLRKTHKRQ